MPLEIHLSGIDEVRAVLLEAVGRADELTKVATVTGLAILERGAKEKLRKTSHTKRTPTPSSPGSPPSLISGALMRSVTTRGPVGGGGTWTGSVGPTTIYGRIQELGGVTGRHHAVTLPARPYMKPLLEESKPELHGVYTTAWSQIFA